MPAAQIQLSPLIKPGAEVLAVFSPLPDRKPRVRAVRIERVWVSLGGTIRFEGFASTDLGPIPRNRVQGDARQCIPLDGLLAAP